MRRVRSRGSTTRRLTVRSRPVAKKSDGASAGRPLCVAQALSKDIERWTGRRAGFGHLSAALSRRAAVGESQPDGGDVRGGGRGGRILGGTGSPDQGRAEFTRAAARKPTPRRHQEAEAEHELERSKTVQERYDLAMDAIKTFHTGVVRTSS